MRCSEAIHQLRTTPEVSAAVSAHLADCADCASWAEDDADLLRAWDATRPVEPTPQAWDSLWLSVSRELDAAERPRVYTMPETPIAPRLRPALFVLSLVQAAAILLAVFLLPGRQPHRGETLAQITPSEVVIDAGEITMLHDKAGKLTKIVLASAADDNSDTLDGNYAMLNVLESMGEKVD